MSKLTGAFILAAVFSAGLWFGGFFKDKQPESPVGVVPGNVSGPFAASDPVIAEDEASNAIRAARNRNNPSESTQDIQLERQDPEQAIDEQASTSLDAAFALPTGEEQRQRQFESEAVDPNWGPLVEARVSGASASGNFALAFVDVDCRTTLCRVSVSQVLSPLDVNLDTPTWEWPENDPRKKSGEWIGEIARSLRESGHVNAFSMKGDFEDGFYVTSGWFFRGNSGTSNLAP